MTEFWVSQERHWCKFCMAWMAKSSQAIRHHETGKRHKEAVREHHFNRRAKKETASREQAELQRAIAKIESAAQSAVANDAANFVGGAAGVGLLRGSAAPRRPSGRPPPPQRQRPPPPPPRRASAPPNRFPAHGGEEDSDDDDDGGGLERGHYVVSGATYLEGLHFERLLIEGCRGVEVWSEKESAWRAASIAGCTQTAVPNTTIVIRRYGIRFNRALTSTPSVEVMSDQIRLRVAPAPPLPPGAAAAAPPSTTGGSGRGGSMALSSSSAAPLLHQSQPIDAVGFGGWTSVAEVVEEKGGDVVALSEAAATAAAAAAAAAAVLKANTSRAAAHSETSASFLNPFGGAYRGVDISAVGSDEDVGGEEPEVNDGSAVPKVGFKKRKRARGKGRGKRTQRVSLG